MNMSCWLLAVMLVAPLNESAFRARVEQERAFAVLSKAGAIIERDARHPDNPVIAVDLNFIGAGDHELEQ